MEKNMLQLVTANGEIHGLTGELANDCKESDMEKLDEKIKNECKKLKKEDAKLVKARYVNHKTPTGKLHKAYCKWPGDNIQKWTFISGYTYEVPLGLVKEVNSSGLIQRSKDDSGKSSADGIEGVFREHQFYADQF